MARTPSVGAGLLVTAGGLALLLQGCRPTLHYEQQEVQVQHGILQMQQSLQEDVARCRLEVAALRADLRAFRESQNRLCLVIDALRQENDALVQEIEKLCRLVASLESRGSTPDNAWRDDMMAFEEILGERQPRRTGPCGGSGLVDAMVRNLELLRGVSESDNAADRLQEYTVHSGDTVSAIARVFGVTVDALRSANDIKGDEIRVGQRLTIPPR